MSNVHDTSDRISRREFIRYSGAVTALSVGHPLPAMASSASPKTIRIKQVDSSFEREPLHQYRFKGSAITESWQTAALLESDSGIRKVGLGTQGVLWSDSTVFAAHSERAGNALMYAVSDRALQMLRGTTFSNPVDLLDQILPEVYTYAKKVTSNPDLRKTFALNALVCVDNAAWLLYAEENKISTFDDMIPAQYRPGLSHHHNKVASIPSFSVGTTADTIKAAADQGYFIMKLKTGSAGTQQEMIEKDIAFLTALHKAIGNYETPYTQSGKIPYYFDANGRYEKKETLLRFLDHARKIGAFDQIAVIEEPFPEHVEDYVGDLGVRVAADESAHTVEDAARRIELGYSAIAVKAIAKTLSMTMKIAQLAYEKNVPCFCADLTVNPILVEWNKNVAARLPAFPGMSLGLQETNGHQYYKNWDKLVQYHPYPTASWTQMRKGVFELNDDYYQRSGGIFAPSAHYVDLFKQT
ncbi:hypothetical protein BN8_02275 [Fibrisoma limi BUZ 3]|uniref:Enolase C-terminal domain-containing protein n=1 Tax=Fibrisoma limi BUZ 3 TaxID=1185876 RepID=I2GH24_9BACT|nr:enolase C-terminal domain-like protein [Fibrisoma limi]CCH53199.1 hypothetical protein BN8_02275 [Fibrisoma limi BUZ 3]